MSIAESLLPEIDQETATTKRVLERVPEDKLSWKPHEKSFSLAQLALHVATTPGQIANLVTPDEVELPASFEQSEAQSKEEVLTAHEESVAKAKQYLSGLSDEAAMATWRVVSGGKRSDGGSTHRHDPLAHAQSLVSPPRPVVGLLASARRARAVDLRPQRRRKPFRAALAVARDPVMG